MSSLPEIMDALTSALEPIGDEIPNLQITDYLNGNPTPPSIDVYPGDPFQDGLAFGSSFEYFFTVRARVTTADRRAGQAVLLQLLEPEGPSSVQDALITDQTLGGIVASVGLGEEGTPGVSGFRIYGDAGTNGQYLGCEWRVRVLT